METNKTINPKSELGKKARKLLKAGDEYWQIYQKELGSAAVVWLRANNGHFILFTRSEYKKDILESAGIACRGEPVMFEPFTEQP
ncbi:MAG: hypothetical protein MUP16_00890 [Sedimentisphaerales bacterium]|nr:hypothetical protein [Sedimentisphaerales bacterium]